MMITDEGRYIHLRLKNPELFSKIRTLTFSVDKGIKARRGVLKNNPKKWSTQALLFKKSKGWTKTNVRTWHLSPKHKKQFANPYKQLSFFEKLTEEFYK